MEERELSSEFGQAGNWPGPESEQTASRRFSGSAWEELGISSTDGEQSYASPVVPEPVGPGTAERVEQAVQMLLTEMADLRRDFEAKVKYDGSKERVIESLHRELQMHQQGLHFRVLQPIFLDLIALYDEMGQIIEGLEAEALSGSGRTVQDLRMYQETIGEALRRHGVEFFRAEEEVFQPQKQRSVKVIPTSDQALDRHIARRVRWGFLYGEKLLRHEMVDIFKYKSVAE